MPSTSEYRSVELIASLHHQPLLVVLRAHEPRTLSQPVKRLAELGVRHIEIAWSDHPDWAFQSKALLQAYPQVRFGAASVVSSVALEAVVAAGLSFAVSPLLDPQLQRQADALGITLVPGVMSPSEVHQARSLGCALVKLFPAVTLGSSYWRRLAGPLGGLPFCIAAGGLGPADLPQWLGDGVDAVAIGGCLNSDQALQELAQWLSNQSD